MNKCVQIFLTSLLLGSSLMLPSATSAKHLPHSKPEVTVAILMFDGVQIIDFSGPYEVFGQAGFGVFTVSADGEPVETAMGLHTTPDYALENVPEFDVLLVPGGDIDAVSHDEKVRRFVKSHAARSKPIMSVCTGSYILAEAGVLDGIKATTFHRSLADFENEYPAVDIVRDVRWTDDANVITSAGLSSGIDAALYLVGKHRGVEIARSTALHLEYDWQPQQGFVRTKLADRHFPAVQVDWPKGTKLDTIYSIGDESHWRRRFLISSPSDSDQLVLRIERAMDNQESWTRGTGSARAWRSKHQNKTLRIDLVHISSQNNEHEFEIALKVTDQQESH